MLCNFNAAFPPCPAFGGLGAMTSRHLHDISTTIRVEMRT